MRNLIKNGSVIIVIGIIGLFIVLGTELYSGYAYENAAVGYTPQEIAAMDIHPININTASAEELTVLPEITLKTAQSIIDYREENGSFQTVEEIINVNGIGKKTYRRISCYITVS